MFVTALPCPTATTVDVPQELNQKGVILKHEIFSFCTQIKRGVLSNKCNDALPSFLPETQSTLNTKPKPKGCMGTMLFSNLVSALGSHRSAFRFSITNVLCWERPLGGISLHVKANGMGDTQWKVLPPFSPTACHNMEGKTGWVSVWRRLVDSADTNSMASRQKHHTALVIKNIVKIKMDSLKSNCLVLPSIQKYIYICHNCPYSTE